MSRVVSLDRLYILDNSWDVADFLNALEAIAGCAVHVMQNRQGFNLINGGFVNDLFTRRELYDTTILQKKQKRKQS